MTKNIPYYDTIVIGLGSMGSAALHYLAKSGANVLGIEQFGPLHENGSYSGYSRIIRKAYFEHPAYVPLLESAYHEWYQLEDSCSEILFHKTGLLYIDSENGPIGNGVLDSASEYDIPIQKVEVRDAKISYPYFTYDHFSRILLEKNAGFLDVEKSLTAFQHIASENKASFRYHSKVSSWIINDDKVIVLLQNGEEFHTAKLVLCGGAYTNQIIQPISLPLKVTKQLLVWVDTFLSEQEETTLPCWTYCTPDDSRIFYGFPKLAKKGSPAGLKIAYHSPGESILPENLSNIPNKEDLDKIYAFMDQYMPGVFKKKITTKNCLYTNTPDENFILDYLPKTNQQVIIAAGFSGHGFKFVPAIGKVMAEMAFNNNPSIDIDFLRIDRFE
jgi:sarcosine oxidase